jgi:hypothetical protein
MTTKHSETGKFFFNLRSKLSEFCENEICNDAVLLNIKYSGAREMQSIFFRFVSGIDRDELLFKVKVKEYHT